MTKPIGRIKAAVSLSNPGTQSLQRLEADALAYTGINYLCIPAQIAQQLGLKTLEERTVVVADGSLKTCAYVGPIQISCLHQTCITGALVLGDEILLGNIPMRDLNLRIHPERKKLVVRGENGSISGMDLR